MVPAGLKGLDDMHVFELRGLSNCNTNDFFGFLPNLADVQAQSICWPIMAH